MNDWAERLMDENGRMKTNVTIRSGDPWRSTTIYRRRTAYNVVLQLCRIDMTRNVAGVYLQRNVVLYTCPSSPKLERFLLYPTCLITATTKMISTVGCCDYKQYGTREYAFFSVPVLRIG